MLIAMSVVENDVWNLQLILTVMAMKWNELTDRQKSLDKSIDRSGVKLDDSDSCLRRVMVAVGATASEASFIRQRIDLRLRTAALIEQTDEFINNTEQMLDRFEKEDEEWRRIGRTLGFDF